MSLSTMRTVAKRPWICTQLEVNQVTCEWTLTTSKLLSTENGEAHYSPLFYTGNGKEQWKLELYPRGWKETYADAVSCFLHLESSEKLEVHAEYKISMLKSDKMIVERMFIEKFDRYGGRGKANFVEQSKLLGSDCSEVTIIVYCEVDTAIPKEQLAENLGLLCRDPKFSDITIIVGDSKFPAHKSILSVRSSVFAAMFDHEGMDENCKNEVKIQDMEPAVVKGMLEYVYTGQVGDLNEIAEGLLGAAEKYDLQVLKALCEEALYKNLDVNNAAEILMLADLYRAPRLKEFSLKFIKDNLRGVLQTDGYDKINDLALLKEIISFGV